MNSNLSAESNSSVLEKENSSKDIHSNKLWNLNFFLLWQGQLVSAFGDSVYDIALGFWILAKTGSTGLMGILMAAAVIPRVILSPIAGTYVDRHNRKTILIIADIVRGIAITFVGIAALMNFIEIWMVLVGGIILGVCGSFFNPAVQSSIPDIVPGDKLVKANSSISMATTGTSIVGKTAGGFLYLHLGAPLMFLINGISYILSACTEIFIKIPNVQRNIKDINFIDDLKSGFDYVRNFTGLKYLYIAIAFLNFFATMGITLLLPLFNVKEYLGPEKYGVAMGFSLGGMFAGFLILSVIDLKKMKKSRLFVWGGIVSTLVMGPIPFIPNYPIIVLLLFINGFFVALLNSILQSSLQAAVPMDMRGKVFGFRRTLSSSLVPLGMATGGILAEFTSIDIVIALGNVIILALFTILAFVKPVKDLIDYDRKK